MPLTITATYEHGVFVPQTPVDLPEHAKVKVSIPSSLTKAKKKAPIAAILDLSDECTARDLSANHDEYLYGKDPL